MRKPLALLLIAASFAATAQSTARTPPPGSKAFEDAPPPPPMLDSGNPAIEPQVTTRVEGDNTIQEYRVNGKLYMQRVTPKHGHAYILMDGKGDGTFSKQDNTLDGGVRVPQWVLLEF